MTIPQTRRRFLFIHQNFPGQFGHLSTALARQGHEVVALCIGGAGLPQIRVVRYAAPVSMAADRSGAVAGFEPKVARGLACARAMAALRREGFTPDVVIAHPGWGEPLFVKDVWPQTRLMVFHEYYYAAQGSDVNFDPEFARDNPEHAYTVRIRNSHLLHALVAADGILTPTRWQQAQLPEAFQKKSCVVFDGVDTDRVAPDATAFLELTARGLRLTPRDEVITFVNRNLEPYRGFHVFMRALPALLAQRPQARVIIVGGDEVSYGTPPAQGGTWRQQLLAEVGAKLPLDRVHFVGRLPYATYLNVLQVSSCHVYLTYPFVLGWSCVEAMAAGCAIVGSDTPPVREFIRHGVNGVLTDFFDQQALVDQVCEVLADRQAHDAMRRRARAGIVQNHDLSRVCLPRQLDYLGQVLGEPGALRTGGHR